MSNLGSGPGSTVFGVGPFLFLGGCVEECPLMLENMIRLNRQ